MSMEPRALAHPKPVAPPTTALAQAERQLAAASRLVEAVAYDLAGEISSDRVARMMLIAADLERMASSLTLTSPFCPKRVSP